MTATLDTGTHTCLTCGRVGSKQFTTGSDGPRCSNRHRCADRVAQAAGEPPPVRITEPAPPIHLTGRLACAGTHGIAHPAAAEVTCHDCLRRYAAYLFLGGKPL